MKDFEIIDSHIHLWPASMANEESHAYMTDDFPLRSEHLLDQYTQATGSSRTQVRGAIYVETDVRYESRVPDHSGEVAEWAKGPLEEIAFLRDLKTAASEIPLLAVIPWAPLPHKHEILLAYLDLARRTAEDQAWAKTRGFRFLVQFIADKKKFHEVVSQNSNFVTNLQHLGREGFIFEVAVDQNRNGAWQLEEMADLMEKTHQGVDEKDQVVFVCNHLCKPKFFEGADQDDEKTFEEWKSAVERLSRIKKTYMKLSGAFSELPDSVVSTFEGQQNERSLAEKVSTVIEPWFKAVLACFGPKRIMFGSDWPVCNLQGPKGASPWEVWKLTVEILLETAGLTDEDKAWIWARTAREAYGISA